MEIGLDTLEKQRELAGRNGGAVASLLGLGGSLESQPLFAIEKGVFGGRGEVFSSDSHIEFRCDRGFSKLKESRRIEYGAVTGLEFSGASSWLRWTFIGAQGRFEIGLVCYGPHNGISPTEHIWYDIDTFPARSGAFFRAMGEILPGTALRIGFDSSSTVASRMEDAVTAFEAAPLLASDSITQLDVYAPWTALYQSFSLLLAGAACASEKSMERWLESFEKLDGVYARILRRFRAEIDALAGAGLFGKERAILSLSDQFDRLSAIWYTRQILRLHLAEKHIPEDRIRHWTLKLLKPRARRYANDLRIQLPEAVDFEEQLAALEA